ncbi:MAG TPA: hypothetical protein VJ804_04490 [Acidimicrobiales bacterium]|nr:hypothetical protein [Acidimicrobiales bacterium]
MLLGALLLLLLTAASVVQAGPAQAQAVQASIDDAQLEWGASTTVHGTGWQPGAQVDVILYPGPHLLASTTAAEDGTIATTITIPEGLGSSNEYKLGVQGGAADGTIGAVSIDVTIVGPTPTVSVADPELAWGEVTTVSGQRFNPGAAVTISLFPNNQVLAETTVREDATFATDVQIPSGLRSSQDYQIVVTGQGIDLLFHFIPTAVTIVGPRPTISVSLARLAWGQATQVHGDLWSAGSTVKLHILPDTIPIGEATVAPDGTFDTAVRMPSDLPTSDRYFIVVTGTGADGHFAYVPEPITIIGDRPFIDVSTNRPGRGGSVTVDAHRLEPGSRAVLTLTPGFERLGEETVRADGTFTTTVRIPEDAAGVDPHVLVVTGVGHDGLFAYVPALMILDGDGSAGATPPPFDLPGDDDPPRPDFDEDGFSGAALPAAEGTPTNILLALLLALLTALIVAALLLATRKDLREAVARRWAGLVRRIPRPWTARARRTARPDP